MDGGEPQRDASEIAPRRRGWRRKRVALPVLLAGLLALALSGAWLARERIAGNVIEGQLAGYGIPATYEIARIGGRRQVLRNLVVGDPGRPDLVAQQAEVQIVYRLDTPQIGRITLVRPRLYGRWTGGRVSFGTLDRVLYRRSGRPPGLPKLDIAVRDGRALIRTPVGPVGAKLDGAGRLADGFSGTLAVAAPALALPGCRIGDATLYGKITSVTGQPRFAGPVRWRSLACPGSRLATGAGSAELHITSDAALAGVTGRAALALGPARVAAIGFAGAQASVRASWKDGLLAAQHTAALRGVTTPQARAALATVTGATRMSGGFARLDTRAEVEGEGIGAGPAFAGALRELGRAGRGTPVAPLTARMAAALEQQARGSRLTADLAIRRTARGTSVTIPRAELRGRGGAVIAALSRGEAVPGAAGGARLAGNIALAGPDLPHLTGRMERSAGGNAVFRLTIAPYAAGTASLAIPQLSIAQSPGGALGFAGRIIASGPLPGGAARGLDMPVEGRWVPGGTLALWPRCTAIGYDRLTIANLTLQKRALTLCPSPGRAIVESGGGGLRIAAGVGALDLAGTLGRTPIRIASGPVGFAYPGVMAAREVTVALGPAATASRFAISNLTAKLGVGELGGRFTGADVRLNAVPLDLREATGSWRYAGGALLLGEGAFRLVDRQADARFEPLLARDATLRLAANAITAGALLRHPASDRVVTEVSLRHDLATGRGFADLAVPGLLFDRQLQPVALTRRALGVIANARGKVTGAGRVDWGRGGVTSTGAFSTDGLDFAAAFGPVRGARGTVRFDDLINLTTAPGQTLRIASVNPGIEVTDGEFTFQLRGGRLLTVEGGNWPFMGGRLILKTVDLNFGVKEQRRYEFEIVGLDAAAFVARFELPNIAATGIFDGTVPIVFDASGNGRIEGGLLTARAPGGNVSYVGDLTYKDLSPVANFAFDTLRSLDYQAMTIAMNGSLTGEIVTNVRFDGVRQGAEAKRNIVTRALANLPIQFRVNIRAPFYQLITSFKSLRDPAAVRDPRSLGLLSDDGTRLLKPSVRGEEVQPKLAPADVIQAGKPAVQN